MSGEASSQLTNLTPAQKSPTISAISMMSEIRQDNALISPATRVYFQERLRGRLYDLVMKEFEKYREGGRTRAQLAARLGKRPEQITRWLSEPGNLTIDTLSDLLLGISGSELAMSLENPARQPRPTRRLPEALLAARQAALQPSLTTQIVHVVVQNGPALAVSSTLTSKNTVTCSEPVK